MIANTKCLIFQHLQKNYYFRLFLTKLQRITQKVYHHLQKTTLISKKCSVVSSLLLSCIFKLQNNLFVLCYVWHDTECSVYNVMHIKETLVQPKSWIFHLGQVQKIHHQGAHNLWTESHHSQFLNALCHFKTSFTYVDLYTL